MVTNKSIFFVVVRWPIVAVAFVVLALTAVSCTEGSTILFRPATGHFAEFGLVPQNYGSRITSTVQDGYSYGLEGGPTPNIVAQCNTTSMPQIQTWDYNFGDLVDVAIPSSSETQTFELDLIADPGYIVNLLSFDMASWTNYISTINSVSVVDGTGTILFNQPNASVQSTPTSHTHYAFTGVQSPTVKIKFDSLNTDADDVGITNINFSQSASGPTIDWKGGTISDPTNWNVAANWNPDTAVPNGPGTKVSFGNQPAANNVVDMISQGQTVGTITFSANTSTTIQSSGGFALTLDNNGSVSTIDVAGTHTISAPVVLNNDATISGTGTLNLSGGITGSHDLEVDNNLTATSIQVDTLTSVLGQG